MKKVDGFALARYYKCNEFKFKLSNDSDYQSVIYEKNDILIENYDDNSKLIEKYCNKRIKNRKFKLLDLCINLSISYSLAKRDVYSLIQKGKVIIKDTHYEYMNENIEKPKKREKHLSREELEKRRQELIKRMQEEMEENEKNEKIDTDDEPDEVLKENLKLYYTLGRMYKYALKEIDQERNAIVRMKLKYMFNEEEDNFLTVEEQLYDGDISYECYKDFFRKIYINNNIQDRISAIYETCGIINTGGIIQDYRIMIKRILFMLIIIDDNTYDDILEIFN